MDYQPGHKYSIRLIGEGKVRRVKALEVREDSIRVLNLKRVADWRDQSYWIMLSAIAAVSEEK